MKYKDFTITIFRGIGQVMLQKNAITGLVFLIGIFWVFWLYGIGAFIGSLVGTLTAMFLKYNEQDVLDGLYGFNGTLVGIAMLLFFEPTVLTFVILIIAVCVSSIVMNFMHERKLYPYTFPFVLTTWVFVILIKFLNLLPSALLEVMNFAKIDFLSGISLGFSQVFLQASIVTGILFFIAILINSRISSLYALLGSVVGLLVGISFFPSSVTLMSTGFFGFNGVLCGIAFADKRWSSFIFAIIAIVLSVVIVYDFVTLGLIALTAPFVFATWIVIFCKNKFYPVSA